MFNAKSKLIKAQGNVPTKRGEPCYDTPQRGAQIMVFRSYSISPVPQHTRYLTKSCHRTEKGILWACCTMKIQWVGFVLFPCDFRAYHNVRRRCIGSNLEMCMQRLVILASRNLRLPFCLRLRYDCSPTNMRLWVSGYVGTQLSQVCSFARPIGHSAIDLESELPPSKWYHEPVGSCNCPLPAFMGLELPERSLYILSLPSFLSP